MLLYTNVAKVAINSDLKTLPKIIVDFLELFKLHHRIYLFDSKHCHSITDMIRIILVSDNM